MPLANNPIATKGYNTFSIFSFLKKHWWLVLLFIFIIPLIIESIRSAISTGNWSLPFFELAKSILAGDTKLYDLINTFQTNPDLVIGMAKPVSGIWNSIVYYFHFSLFVYKILSYVYLIFFPFMVLYKILSLRDDGQKAKNFFIAFIIFVVYLFITNSVILVHDVIKGTTIIKMPNSDTFSEYFFLTKQIMPFHGLYNLGEFIFKLIFIK